MVLLLLREVAEAVAALDEDFAAAAAAAAALLDPPMDKDESMVGLYILCIYWRDNCYGSMVQREN